MNKVLKVMLTDLVPKKAWTYPLFTGFIVIFAFLLLYISVLFGLVFVIEAISWVTGLHQGTVVMGVGLIITVVSIFSLWISSAMERVNNAND